MNVSARGVVIALIGSVLLVSVAAARAGGAGGILTGLPSALAWIGPLVVLGLGIVLLISGGALRTRKRIERRFPGSVVFNSSRNTTGLRTLEEVFTVEGPSCRSYAFTVMIDAKYMTIFMGARDAQPYLRIPVSRLGTVSAVTTTVVSGSSTPAVAFDFEQEDETIVATFVVGYFPSLNIYSLSWQATERLAETISKLLSRTEFL